MPTGMNGQITLQDYIAENFPKREWGGCGHCICKKCLLFKSGRCPYGGCYDDYRKPHKPYDKSHPDEPPRTGWSNWKNDQAAWCRGGIFYPAYECSHFIKYISEKMRVEECILANVVVFQDGYISCSIVDSIGCEECYSRMGEQEV